MGQRSTNEATPSRSSRHFDATVLVVDHQFLPVVPDDAVQRHLLVLWKDPPPHGPIRVGDQLAINAQPLEKV
jgi:hypothetical protein